MHREQLQRGTCVSGPRLDCDDGRACTRDSCLPGGTCAHDTPLVAACHEPARSVLTVQTSGGDATGGRLAWKVDQASATTAAQFANPTMTADYHFCVYAGTATMAIGEATVAADPVKWTAVDSRRYVYRDRDGSAMGITKIGLRSGGAGKGRVIVRARGEHLLPVLRDPAFPLVVQLVNSDNGRCWGASYNAADVVTSTGDQFKAQTQ